MIRKIIDKRIFAFIFFEKFNVHDQPFNNEDNIDEHNLTGFQRLKKLFKINPDDSVNPHLVNIYNTITMSCLLGGVYGACKKSRVTFIRFLESNEATQFPNQYQAKMMLADKMFMSFLKGFASYGVKISLFCSTLVTTYTLISVYRNKDSTFHYTIAGMTAGSVYKFPLGPRAMVSGAIFGGFFGTICGVCRSLVLSIVNMTEEDARQTLQEAYKSREDSISKGLRELYFEEEKKGLRKSMEAIK